MEDLQLSTIPGQHWVSCTNTTDGTNKVKVKQAEQAGHVCFHQIQLSKDPNKFNVFFSYFST